MMLFGLKTEAWLDVWSLEHLISGITLSTMVTLLCGRVFPEKGLSPTLRFRLHILCTLWLAYLWEVVEFYMEAGYTGLPGVTYWFQGVEFWGNRLITDPGLTLLGAVIGLKRRRLRWPARIFAFGWLYMHIAVFPHSMYLHTYL